MTRSRWFLAAGTWLALWALLAGCEWIVDVRGRCQADRDCLATEQCTARRCVPRTGAIDGGGTGADSAVADAHPGDAVAADHARADSASFDGAAAHDALTDAPVVDVQASDTSAMDAPIADGSATDVVVADTLAADSLGSDLSIADVALDSGGPDAATTDLAGPDHGLTDTAPVDHGAPGQAVAIINGDFEDNHRKTWFWDWNGSSGTGELVAGAILGWSTDEDPGVGGYAGKGDSGVEDGGHPGYRLFLNSIDWEVYQTTSQIIQAGDTYQLSWDMLGTYAAAPGGTLVVAVRLYYLDGSTRVTIGSANFAEPQNAAFLPFVLDVVTIPAEAVGHRIGVGFDNISNLYDGNAQTWVGIDNVALTVYR